MARPVPADLEDALAATPVARDRFWSLPPERKDAWVGYVERARVPGARRRRVAETVRRLGGPPRAAGGGVALPREGWSPWLVALALLAVVAALVAWFALSRRDGNAEKPGAVVVTAKARVPKVTGIRFQAAQFQLKEAKLRSAIARRHSSKPRGIVLRQTPGQGTRVPQGTAVALVVSKGPAGVKMPDLVGLAAADAVRALRALKITAKIEPTRSQEAPGTVLAQDPAAGKRAKPGTTVTLRVAKPRPSVDVPNVTGLSEADAVAALKAAGLAGTVARVPSAQPTGTVVAQSPAPGASVDQGAAVRINVSQGQTTTTQTTQAAGAPSTAASGASTGERLADAVARIAQGRLQVVVEYVASSQPAGMVLSNVLEGSHRRLRVSAGPQPKPARAVPDTTGEDAATAQQDLEAAGFAVIQVDWPVSDSANDGIVVAQTPAAGGQAPAGSAIVVYVGSAAGG